MSANKANADAQVLYWSGKLFSADDLRRHWSNQHELVLSPKALLTPLALDELRAKGVIVKREEATANDALRSGGAVVQRGWGYAQESFDPALTTALAAIAREGMAFTPLAAAGSCAGAWVLSVRNWVAENAGALWFCADATLNCCLANKVAGLRAAAVANGWQVGRAFASLGANVLIVEMPGRTFFELRQILRAASAVQSPVCPPNTAKLLLELESHAHR